MAVVNGNKYESAQTSTLVKVIEDATILRSVLSDIKKNDSDEMQEVYNWHLNLTLNPC